MFRLGPWYGKAKESLTFLKVVDYTGPTTDSNCYSTIKANIDVQIYGNHDGEPSSEEAREMPEADIVYLPHVKFDKCWEEYYSLELLCSLPLILIQLRSLVFDEDYKSDLIYMMKNTCELPKPKEYVQC